MTTLIDTRVVPAPDRSEYWAEGIAQHFFPIRVESVSADSFDARLTGGQVGPVAVRSITGLPHRVGRTLPMIASSDPECIILYLVRDGLCRIAQDETSSLLLPGDIAIQDSSRPSVFEATTGFDVLVLSYPKWLIGPRAGAIARRGGTRMAGREAAFARLVTPFVAKLACAADGGGVAGPEGDGAAEMLITMLRTLYGDSGPVPTPAEDLLTRMRGYVAAHLHDPDLGPEQLARAHYVSTRYVHKLFAPTGVGVSAWIRRQRLDGARVELQTTRDARVAEVAARWGYRDAASFARAFREQFDCTPSDARALGGAVVDAAEPVDQVNG
ncbi:helix-turn-helix domain-containing protein [Microbacterium sp. No. 7]|uniref:helix-turn-helix domain-containing protein n=1 Tax=Microbacterium sp. No. 7 TaxID=1714373 RepID=UPI0009E73E28|nr:helix-turn-helix domain-containing protein [Microbacterium sp. No. 7]